MLDRRFFRDGHVIRDKRLRVQAPAIWTDTPHWPDPPPPSRLDKFWTRHPWLAGFIGFTVYTAFCMVAMLALLRWLA